MKNFKKIALSTVAVIGLGTSSAMADGFTSHHSVDEKPYEQYAENLPADEKLELHEYLNYEQREPCQFYQPIPQGFVQDGCHLKRVQPEQKVVEAKQPVQKKMYVNNVITDYEVNFAFDSAAIEPAAGDTLNKVADEIKQYNPREVTIAGHADKAGPMDYNLQLSQERAQAVSDALSDRGVANRILDKEAYGENKPAVDTNDGVALRENRRVVVEFRK